ncbi:MAG: hypothetical protein HDS66_05105 [Bacteroidales bacterium]|nr:hypothetical protein [Bacteroidales bacterium]
MKSLRTYFLLFVLIILYQSTCAWEITTELNMPRCGDKLDIILYENIAPGPAGKNILWDFSQSCVSNKSTTLSYMGNDNELITARFNKYRLHYTLRNDSLLWHGYEDRTISLIDSIGALSLKFPASYGDSCSFFFNMQGKYYLEHLAEETGIGYTKVDGKGTIIMPDGDTITNVLRVYRMYKGTPVVTASNRSLKLKEQNTSQETEYREYDWYAYGYRYPVFSIRETCICETGPNRSLNSFAYMFSRHSQEVDIKNDTANESARKENQNHYEIESKESPLSNLYLTDNGPQLCLTFDYSGDNATISLIVSDSFGISYIFMPKTPIHQGYNEIIIPAHELQKGEYALLLNLNEERISLKFQHR